MERWYNGDGGHCRSAIARSGAATWRWLARMATVWHHGGSKASIASRGDKGLGRDRGRCWSIKLNPWTE